MHSYGGWVQGEDLRWTTPLSGLMVGASMATHHITGHGELTGSASGNTFLSGLLNLPLGSLEREHSRKDDYYQYYLQYTRGRLLLEAEYRREFRNEWVGYWKPGESTLAVTFDAISDSRAWYGAASTGSRSGGNWEPTAPGLLPTGRRRTRSQPTTSTTRM